METQNSESLIEALLQEGGGMSADDLAASAGLTREEADKTAARLIGQGRATWNASALAYAPTYAPVSRGTPDKLDVSSAALDLLEPGMTTERWRRALEDHGYYLDRDEFGRTVEDLAAAEMVRPIYEDSAYVEERYAEDPDAWGSEWPENPPTYEAAGM